MKTKRINYKEFKDTEIGKIPREWKVVELGKICYLVKGTEPGSKSYNTDSKGFRFIRVSDISKQVLESVFVDEKPEVLVFCSEEDILLALDGVPGVVAKGFNGAISSGIRIVKPKINELEKEFLFYILQHRIVQKVIESYTVGTTIKHASRAIDFIKIPLPPLPEQKAIAKILSTVDEAIQKVDLAIEKTERLKKGLMHRLLTKGIGHKEFKDTEIGRIPREWNVVKLDKLINLMSGLYFKFSEFCQEGIRCFKIDNVGFGKVVWDSITYLPYNYLEKYKSLVLNEGDIVIALNRPIINGKLKVAMIQKEDSPSILYQRVGKIIIKSKKLLDNYLFYVFTSTKFKRQLSHFLIGTDQPYIKNSLLLKIKIPLPPLPEQQRIAEILSTVDKKLELEKKHKEKLERIKKGLMNDLLTGRKRVNVMKVLGGQIGD